MESKSTQTEQILSVMQIIAWIAYIGLCIKTGAILISFGVSFVNPEAAKNLYKGPDLRIASEDGREGSIDRSVRAWFSLCM